MSSKFRDLLAQARNRPAEDEEGGAEPTDTGAEPTDTPDELQPVPVEVVPPSLEEPSPEAEDLLLVENDSGTKRGRPRNGKRSDPLFTQITAYISKKTHQEVKVALLHEGGGRQISELVEECLRSWLTDQK